MTDWLSLLVGAVVVDTVTILMNYTDTLFVSKELTTWYTEYRLSAMIMDVLAVLLYARGGVVLAGKKTSSSLLRQVLCGVLVQVVGDLAFYAFFRRVPRHSSRVFDTFQEYAEEVGAKALVADAMMVAASLVLAHVVQKGSQDDKLLALAWSVCLSQYVLYLK